MPYTGPVTLRSGVYDPRLLLALAQVSSGVYEDPPSGRQLFQDSFAGGVDTFYARSLGLPTSVALLQRGDVVIIAVEGTVGGVQLAHEFLASHQGPVASVPGLVSGSFAMAAEGILPAVRRELDRIGPGVRVVLTGHSLGGAVAQVLAHQVAAIPGVSVDGVVTFGAPRVGNADFAAGARWPVVRLVNAGDLVTHLPPRLNPTISSVLLAPVPRMLLDVPAIASYEHAGQHVHVFPGGAVYPPEGGLAVPRNVVALPLEAATGVSVPTVPHAIDEYIRRLQVQVQSVNGGSLSLGAEQIAQPALSVAALGSAPLDGNPGAGDGGQGEPPHQGRPDVPLSQRNLEPVQRRPRVPEDPIPPPGADEDPPPPGVTREEWLLMQVEWDRQRQELLRERYRPQTGSPPASSDNGVPIHLRNLEPVQRPKPEEAQRNPIQDPGAEPLRASIGGRDPANRPPRTRGPVVAWSPPAAHSDP